MKEIRSSDFNEKLFCSFSLFVFLILIFSVQIFGQNLTVRNAHSMVYDSKNRQILLFGGADEKQVFGDLWRLENKAWQLIKTGKSPKPRTFASLVYDEENRRIVLFGGNSVLFGSEENPAELFGDTWEFKDNQWIRLEKYKSPEPRAEAGIVYDKADKRIILFGGYKIIDGKIIKLNDTWELKNRKWKKLNNSYISPRNGTALAFDEKMKKVVLFGGSTANKDYGEETGETWVLEGGSWRELNIDQPENVFNANMVFNGKSKRLLRFGGWDGENRINETWIFKERVWKKLTLKANPSARNHASMVYNAAKKQVVLFGGHNGTEIFGDLWIFEKGKWYKEFESPPIKRISNGH